MKQTLITGTTLSLILSMTSHGLAQDATILMGATALDGAGLTIENATIIVEDGLISCIGDNADCDRPEAAATYDMSGQFITPGLVDAHVHFTQTGWLDGRPDGVQAPDVYLYKDTIESLRADPGRWHRAYLCSGITAVYDVGGADWSVTDPHATDTDRADRVHVRAAGPLITHASAIGRFFDAGDEAGPMFLPFDTDEEAKAGVEHVQTIGGQAIKVWFLQPSLDRKAELDARLMRVGDWADAAELPLIVHATQLEQAKTALRAGAGMLVHSVEDKVVDQEFLDLLLANDAVYAPTLVVGSGWRRALASVVFETAVDVDDPNNCVDPAIMDRINNPQRLSPAFEGRMSPTQAMASLEAVGRDAEIMAQNLRAVHEAGGRIVVATDAGNPLTVHGPSIYWEMEAMQAAGMTPQDIISAATQEGAKAMGLDAATGRLQAGKIADMIILSEDPREDISNFRSLTHVMRRGTLYDQKDLAVR